MTPQDKKKVLLVDDSDLVASMVGQALETAGMSVVRGANGAEGIEMAYREEPDVIIMDAEMPLMQGYLASRLLKSRRGVRDIPIIMHTSLSEDKDKYWALSSGTDEFAEKNFDNIETLVERVAELAEHPPLDLETIREDAARISRDKIFELLGSVLDQQLFQSTIQNLLGRVGKSMDSLGDTARQILELLSKVCETQYAVLLLQYGKHPVAYVMPGTGISAASGSEFMKVCLGDFYTHFPTLDLGNLEEHLLGAGASPESGKTGALKLNSYTSVCLFGRGDTLIGSLHLGNATNNYFSEPMVANIELFARSAGIILDNAIMFNRTNEMHDRIRSAFSKFVPQEIIEELIQSTQSDVRLRGENREVTILFTDIRSFTAISENNSAEKVVEFLNRYFDIMVAIIKKHGGTVDKFIGDAILAIFGAPTSYADNAQRAVLAAMDMIQALPLVFLEDLQLPTEGLKIGIGIHNGEVIVGNIGSADKFNYTVIGDTVNLASRLEGLTKYYRQEIIISEAVKNRLDETIPVWEIDRVRVKGKEEATSIFSIHSDIDETYTPEFFAEFAKALRMYRMGNFDTALEYFNKAHKLRSGDHITRIFVNRCRQFKAEPPPNWDGAQVMESK